MKKFSLFGYKFRFDVKKSNLDDKEIYSDKYFLREKILYFLIIMFAIVISSKFPILYRSNNYKVGDVIKSDIYAPKTIVFKDNDAKEKIIESIITSSEKEYIYSADVKRLYLEQLDNFFYDILRVKDGSLDKVNYKYIEKNTGRKIDEKMVEDILKFSQDEIIKLQSESEKILRKIYDAGVFSTETGFKINLALESELSILPDFEKEIINSFLAPNYVYDMEKTKKFIKEKVSQINDQFIEIKAGTLIVKTGELLTNRKMAILEKMGIYSYKGSIFIVFLNVLYLIIISSLFYIVMFNIYKKDILNKNIYKSVMLIIIFLFLVFRFVEGDIKYLIPIDTALFLLIFLTNIRFGVAFFTFVLMFLVPIIDFDLIYFSIHTFYLLYAAFLLRKTITRFGIISVGIQLATLKLLLFFLVSFFSNEQTFGIAFKSGQIILSGLFSGMITIALLPYFEKTFNLLTKFKLIELADLSHPLLKRLSVEAPGTFHHSMMVANLSENAAMEIDANFIFTRVASYYHDIGKCVRPNYYVENQVGGVNPHDNISPFLSKVIITSHTKDGFEMGKEYQLPKEVRDVMLEHHGTSLLAFFYNKAKQIDPNVNIEEFRYGGPTPKTKESAIIMLADSIEAAARSLDEKTPVTFERILRKIINEKIKDNQLVDADLTFREIEIIINSFIKTLSSVYHVRIKYPGQKN